MASSEQTRNVRAAAWSMGVQRTANVYTTLPESELLYGLTGRERLGRAYDHEVDLLSEHPNIGLSDGWVKVCQIKLLRVPSRRSASSQYSEYCCVGLPSASPLATLSLTDLQPISVTPVAGAMVNVNGTGTVSIGAPMIKIG